MHFHFYRLGVRTIRPNCVIRDWIYSDVMRFKIYINRFIYLTCRISDSLKNLNERFAVVKTNIYICAKTMKIFVTAGMLMNHNAIEIQNISGEWSLNSTTYTYGKLTRGNGLVAKFSVEKVKNIISTQKFLLFQVS